jgi:PAS domain S-box-containing protein
MEILLLILSLLIIALYAAFRRESAERKRFQQALQDHERRFEQIVDNIPLALYIRDPVRGKPTTYMSRAYETLWEQPRQRLYSDSRAWLEPIHPDDLPAVLREMENSYATHNPMNIEFRLIRKDGSVRWAHLKNYHLNPDAEGKPERVVGVLQDTTERRLAEQDRVRLGVEQERNRFLRQLITTISHDFRTPMTVISTHAYLLKHALANPADHQRLTTIEQQIHRLDELLEDAITMTKLDAQVELESALTDLNQVIRELEPDMRAILQRKNHSLNIKFDVETPSVRIHLEWFKQALKNLVENAAQFTAEGQSIGISTAYQGGFAIVEVRDGGLGISSEDLPHIFDPFFRGDKSRQGLTGGAGVGLTIAKQVIDLHHGQIQVESTPGEGSIFRVMLPVAAGAAAKESSTNL